MTTLIAIFLGGGLGSLARYGVSRIFQTTGFPTGTLMANILSCLVLALTVYLLQQKADLNENLRPLLIVGFCGGFSTFSTFSFETLQLIKTQQMGLAVANVLISVLACVGLLYVLTKQMS